MIWLVRHPILVYDLGMHVSLFIGTVRCDLRPRGQRCKRSHAGLASSSFRKMFRSDEAAGARCAPLMLKRGGEYLDEYATGVR